MRRFVGTVIVLLSCSFARSEDLPATPKGPAPLFGVARATEKEGKVTVELFELRDVVGIPVMDHIEFIQMDNWLELASRAVGKDMRAFRPDGKPADPKEVLRSYAKPRAVMYFLGYDKAKPVQPDPFYLSLLKEGSIALALEVPERGGPPVTP
jgi:hypothetical protein